MSIASFIKGTNKKLLLICLTLSTIFWFFTSMSEYYEHTVSCDVQYLNLPLDLIPVFPLTKEIQVQLKGRGYDLLRLYNRENRTVQVDYSLLKWNEEIRQSDLISVVENQLRNYQVKHISPDEVPFVFQEKHSKIVPLRLTKEITTAPTWFIAEDIVLKPDSVTISGPEELVGKIESWNTELLELLDLEENQEGQVNVANTEGFNIQVEPTVLNYQIKVDQWTEKTLSLPIVPINLPDSLIVFLFPKMAELKFQLPLGQYELLKQKQFSLVADFNETPLLKSKKIKLKLQTGEKQIRNIRIEPSIVEYVVSLKG